MHVMSATHARAGVAFLVAAGMADAVSMCLPAVEEAQVRLSGWQAFRLALEVTFGDEHLSSPWRRPCLAGAAAIGLTGLALLVACLLQDATGWRTAAILYLSAAVVGRLIPVLVRAEDWQGRAFLPGYWLWIISMLLGAIGFWLLAMWHSDRERGQHDT